MKNKNFEVRIYYTGFCTYLVEAETEDDAIKKARRLPIDEDEIVGNLENWEEADTVEEMEKYGKNSK